MKQLTLLLILLLFALPTVAQQSDADKAYEKALNEIRTYAMLGRNPSLNLSDAAGYGALTQLPPEIGRLNYVINELHLEGTSLTHLPPEIGNLTNLQQLLLSNSLLIDLPPEISRLTTLQVLGLYNVPILSLPPEIGNLTELNVLDLTDTNITSLPLEMGNLIHLQELRLQGTTLAFPPPEIIAQGTQATITYLRDYPTLVMKQVMVGVASILGMFVLFGVGWRWRTRGSKKKKKNGG